MLALFALPSAWSPQVDGRAVASRRSAISLGAALFAPLPAFAKSKEKAKQEAIQKETAKNAKQAMKEYKYAPRPELEYGLKPDGTMGYIYKEGTVKAGSQGELSSCEHHPSASAAPTAAPTPAHSVARATTHIAAHAPAVIRQSADAMADATQFSPRRVRN